MKILVQVHCLLKNLNRLSLVILFTVITTLVNTRPVSAQDYILPIEVIKFEATRLDDNRVSLNWITTAEIDNDFFEVQRSADGIEFETIDIIQGGGSNTTNISYELTDNSPIPGLTYYRLRQVDFDGLSSYSDIISVSIPEMVDIKLYPNPAKGYVNIQYLSGSVKCKSMLLINSVGEVVKEIDTSMDIVITLDISDLNPGVYYLQSNNGCVFTTKRLLIY